MSAVPHYDFFVSYTSADDGWANWISYNLEAAGFSAFLQAWDIRSGDNFVSKMHHGLDASDRVLIVLSPSYLNSKYGEAEWTAKFDPTRNSVIPVRVRECTPTGLLAKIVYTDLVGLPEADALQKLKSQIYEGRLKPDAPPSFPGAAGTIAHAPKRFPGSLPEIWQVPQARNPNFTGRAELLQKLRSELSKSELAAVALAGLAGVGKSELALEYAYRYASDYDLVWWLRAETPTTLIADLAALGSRLLPNSDAANQPELVRSGLEWLAHNSGWLLIFDNASGPEDCRPYIPHGNAGQVLITTRNQTFGSIATPFKVVPFAREDAKEFVLKRTHGQDAASAEELCNLLGDLPLALSHAAAYLEAAAISIPKYLKLFRLDNPELSPVTQTIYFSITKLQNEEPVALQLLGILAFFAPDNIPRDVFETGLDAPRFFYDALAGLRRYSLVDAAEDTLSIHRLVQESVRNYFDDDDLKELLSVAVQLLKKAFPAGSFDYRAWPLCNTLLPHALAATEFAEKFSIEPAITSDLLHTCGYFLYQLARYDEAAALYARALPLAEQAYGTEHEEVAKIVNNLGAALYHLDDLAGAMNASARAVQIYTTLYGPESPDLAPVLNQLGVIWQAAGNLDEALLFAQDSNAINVKTYGPVHPWVAIDYSHIAMLLKDKGDLDEALDYANRAVSTMEQTGEKGYANLPSVYYNRAMIKGERAANDQDLIAVFQDFEHAWSISEATKGREHPTTQDALRMMNYTMQAIARLRE